MVEAGMSEFNEFLAGRLGKVSVLGFETYPFAWFAYFAVHLIRLADCQMEFGIAKAQNSCLNDFISNL
jgi:hypothetical protein